MSLSSEQLNEKVEIFSSNKDWNWELLNQIVPPNVKRIQPTCPPDISVGPDRLFWQDQFVGIFTVKSAYSSLMAQRWSNQEMHWKQV